MRCEKCGTEYFEGGSCPVCGMERAGEEREPRVQILTPAEKNAYRGVTIEEGSNEREAGPNIRFERRRKRWGSFSYMTTDGLSWQSKLTILLGAAAVLFFVFFIALPVAIAGLLFGVVSWFLYRLLH